MHPPGYPRLLVLRTDPLISAQRGPVLCSKMGLGTQGRRMLL